MRRLVLLRHGTSEERAASGRDFDRVLAPVGRQEAQRMGTWLARHAPQPDLVVSSPAPRALQTARLAVAAWTPPPTVVLEPRLYGCAPASLLRILAELPAVPCAMLVGHNPSMEGVALHLTGDQDLEARGLDKAGGLVARLPDDWSDLGGRSAQDWVVASPSTIG